ncbi:MAG: 2-succinyl-5-enolpyruvyl-6-hydroxy-3-cyclohexene-1-carboxylic-acid synthase [Actinomycetota bacterium]
MRAVNPSQALAVTLVDEFARHGVTHAMLAPGSRSAALALALAEDDRIELLVGIDERSAAFLALGLARATSRPALVACTSGTAAANFLPAVVEATNDRIPLIVLTADRPPELRGTGANQTIDQLKLYGDAVRWFCEMGTPDGHPGGPRHWRSSSSRAFAQSSGVTGAPGPVHLNLAFREPLVPEPVDGFELELAGRPDGRPWTQTQRTPRPPDAGDVDEVARLIAAHDRGVIVAGAGPLDGAALLELARRAGYPVLAEPASNARTDAPAVAHYEALLRVERFTTDHRPGLVLRFGKTGLSRALGRYLEPCPNHLSVDPYGGWVDPQRLAHRLIHADPGLLCRAVSELIPDRADSKWLRAWQHADDLAGRALDGYLDALEEPSEPRTARDVAAALPDGSNLVVSSSMPVRDLDGLMAPRTGIRVHSNRGANGIDGFVSTTIGIALGSEMPTVALCGDLALLHDQNGLLAARSWRGAGCVFVIVNNDGGGIFSFLEQAGYPDHFERVFGTPHGIDFADVARAHRCGYALVDDPNALPPRLTGALDEGGVHLIEVRTDRARNVAVHREMYAAVENALLFGH